MKIVSVKMCIGLTMFCVLTASCSDSSAMQNEPSVKTHVEGQPIVLVSELDRLFILPEDASNYQIRPELFSSAQLPEGKISQSLNDSGARQKDMNLKKTYRIERASEFEIYLPD